jgi:hypothetical protein
VITVFGLEDFGAGDTLAVLVGLGHLSPAQHVSGWAANSRTSERCLTVR